MDRPLTDLRGLDPATAAEMARAGIATIAALEALGVDEAYARMVRAGTRPHFIGFYAIEMALQGRPWNDCRGEEKAALRRRFDAVRAQAHDPHREAFEAMMDALGVVERRAPTQPADTLATSAAKSSKGRSMPSPTSSRT